MSDSTTRLIASAGAAGIAEVCTLPMDVCKVRLQMGARYSGFLDVLSTTVREEGAGALFKGLSPALLRQVSYSSLCFVLFEPIRNAVSSIPGFGSSDNQPSFATRLLAGGLAGGIGIGIMNPTEVLKTQIQTSTNKVSMASVFKKVMSNAGPLGFWAGVYPNVVRCFLVNAAELGTYDQAKSMVVPYFGDNILSHVSASGVAGLTSAVTSTPVDVVKTRFMNQAGGERKYKGMMDAGIKIYKEEGIQTLYSGFAPIVIRKLVWCTVFFVLYERARSDLNYLAGPSGSISKGIFRGVTKTFRVATTSGDDDEI